MSGYRFPKAARLNHPREFKQVFANGQRHSDACFTVISTASAESRPRLGLVVTRKALRRAADRNRIKRMVRESFRLHQAHLPARDIIVMPRFAASTKPGPALRVSLSRHWKRITDTCEH